MILILDNCRICHAKIVKKIAELLKITLIHLPIYSPDFNPIEDLWRAIKRKIYSTNYKNLTELKEIFAKNFYKKVDNKSRYTKWIEKVSYVKKLK